MDGASASDPQQQQQQGRYYYAVVKKWLVKDEGVAYHLDFSSDGRWLQAWSWTDRGTVQRERRELACYGGL